MQQRMKTRVASFFSIKETEEGYDFQFARWVRFFLAGRWLAAALIALYFCIFLVTVIRFPYFSPVATVDEQLMYYQVARNFNEHGFLNGFFLQDMSTSSNPAHHPFIYNHMPPGPEIFIALLTRLFGEHYRLVRFAFALLFLVGIVYYLRFARLVLEKAGLSGEGFALLFMLPYTFLHSMDHPAYSPFPFFAFFPLVALHTYYQTGRRSRYYLALGIVFLSSLYLVYQQLFMLFVCWTLLYAFQLLRFERKHLVTFWGAGLLGIFLHLLQSFMLLGPLVFVQEFWFTLSNRMFGVPTIQALKAFYQSIGVVHQGIHHFDLGGLFDAVDNVLLSPGRRHLTQLGIFLFILAVVREVLLVTRLDRQEGGLIIPRGDLTTVISYFVAMGIWLTGTNTLPLFMFPAYSANYQLSDANQFFLAIGAVAVLAYVLREIVIARPWLNPGAVANERGWKWVVNACLWGVLVLGFGLFGYRAFITQLGSFQAIASRELDVDPQRELVGIMKPLQGKATMTNVYPSITGFFTQEATFGGCELAAFPTSGFFNYLVNNDFEEWSRELPVGWRLLEEPGVAVHGDAINARKGMTSAQLIVPFDALGQLRQWVTFPRQPEDYKAIGAAWVKTNMANRVRVYVHGVSQVFSPYHPGDGTWRLLAMEATMPASVISAPSVQLGIQVEAGEPLEVNVDSAALWTMPSNGAVQSEPWSTVDTTGTLDDLKIAAALESNAVSLGVDPSQCHTTWMKGYGSSVDVKPTYYILFRSLFTGFTLCRERKCLDRLEDYVTLHYKQVFKNELCTVFSLEDQRDSGEAK